MPRTAQHLIPATLTFLIEEQRVCEAEALIAMMAQGNGHATWTPALAHEWREHLRDHVGDFGPHPLFPLLYVRNSQIPRAIRAFDTDAASLPPAAAFALFLEMLRLFALKRRVPLSAYATKLKRDRVGLITQERFDVHREQLFAHGLAFLTQHAVDQALIEIAVQPNWIVYPIVREFLADLGARLEASGARPPWWPAISLRLAIYAEQRGDIEALLPEIDHASLEPTEREQLRSRLTRRIARLADLEAKTAERERKEAAYLASVQAEWLHQLTQLPILERSPKAWSEYQDFRDKYTPIAVGTAEEILPLLPREATYTVWEVGAILPFEEAKAIRLRPLKTKIRKVNPEDTLTWACPGLEHYTVEEGISRLLVTHFHVLRLRDAAYAVFNLTPPDQSPAA